MPPPTGIPSIAQRSAPTAHPIPAWGEAPCPEVRNAQGLKARLISVPQISFIAFHSVFLEKCTEFILKRLLAVMYLLGIDVVDQRTQVRWPYRERAVTSLPRELRQIRRLGLKPFRRRGLQQFHQVSDVCRSRQTNRDVNMVRNSPDTIAFTFGIAGDCSKICVKRRTHGSIENRVSIFRTEDHMDQNKRERLGHRVNYRSGFQPSYSTDNVTWGVAPCWYGTAPMALAFAAALFFFLLPAIAHAQPAHQLKIKIINAKTNQPITDEHLNVALRADQIGSVAMATDKNGIILVDTGDATTIRILSNMYADCRPRGELYTDYSIATILSTGITTGNLCSSAKPAPKAGYLTIFEIPKTYIPNYPHPPASNLPHSDENPHTNPN